MFEDFLGWQCLERLHCATWKISEEAPSVQLWAFSATVLWVFLATVLWVSCVRRRCSYTGAFSPYFVSDTIDYPHFSMHGLDKVAHVSHVPGPASVGWAPGSAPSASAGFPRSRRLSRPWTRLRRLGTGLRAFGIGRPAFPAVNGRATISPSSLGGGRRREATLRRRGFDFCRSHCFFGSRFGFCGTTVNWVRNGCSARMSESARGYVTIAKWEGKAASRCRRLPQHTCWFIGKVVSWVWKSLRPSRLVPTRTSGQNNHYAAPWRWAGRRNTLACTFQVAAGPRLAISLSQIRSFVSVRSNFKFNTLQTCLQTSSWISLKADDSQVSDFKFLSLHFGAILMTFRIVTVSGSH